MPKQRHIRKVLIPLVVLTQLVPLWAEASQKTWFVLMQQSHSYVMAGDFLKALPCSLAALREAKEFRSTDPRYTETLRLVSSVYMSSSQYSQAEPFLKEEIKILDMLGDDFPDLDYDYFSLGIICESRGNLELAETYQRKALRLACSLVKRDEPYVTQIACHLAAILYLQGKDKEADELAKSIAAFTWNTWKRPQDLLRMLPYMRFDIDGARSHLQSDQSQLSYVYCRALRKQFIFHLRECAHRQGRTSFAYCHMLLEFAWILNDTGDTAEAANVHRECFALLDQIAARVPATDRAAFESEREAVEHELALVLCRNQHDYVRAERLIARSIQRMENSTDSKDSHLFQDFVSLLCDCADGDGHRQFAIDIVENVLRQDKWLEPPDRSELQRRLALLLPPQAKLQVKDHRPDRALLLSDSMVVKDNLSALASALAHRKRFTEAEKAANQYLALPQDRERYKSFDIQNLLIDIYIHTGRLGEAEQACQKLLSNRDLARKNYVRCLYQLGVTQTLQGRADLAEPLYKRARIFCITPFSMGDGFSLCMLNLLEPLHQQHLADAEHLCEEEWQIYQNDDGKETNAKQGLDCLLCELANIYTCQKRYDKALPLYQQALKICSRTTDSSSLSTQIIILQSYQKFLHLTNKLTEIPAIDEQIKRLQEPASVK